MPPKKQAAPTPPPAPTKDEAADSSKTGPDKRRGYQSTILGGRQTPTGTEQITAKKSLLGQ